MTQEDNLAKYGLAFQSKAIAAMLTDRTFLDQAQDVIEKSHFESDAQAWIVDRILWYFNDYRTVPSMEVFKTELGKVKHDAALRANIIVSLKEAYKNMTSTDIAYIKDEYLKFCKNQAIKNAILQSADMLPTGNYDGIKSIIDKAMHAGQERNYGHDWNEDVEARLLDTARPTVPTNWACINKILDGGLGPGELGIVVAPSGVGKTWALCSLGAAALKRGLNVLHYTFELNEEYVGRRYDTTFSGIEPNKLKNSVDAVKAAIETVPGKLKIKYYPTRMCSVNTLKAHINRMQMIGFIPDLVIIDYMDLMRPTERGNSRYEDLGIVAEEVRGMGGELQFPIWTASQSQRSSMDDDIIEANKISESFMKIMTADVVMSISRKQTDKAENTGRVYFIKNRFGVDGIIFPAKINFMKGIFEVYDEHSPEGQALQGQMQNSDDILRKLMKKQKMEFSSPED